MYTSVSVLLAIAYLALIAINVAFMVKIWKASTSILSIEKYLQEIAYRDTARFIAEVEKGKITIEQQNEALEQFAPAQKPERVDYIPE